MILKRNVFSKGIDRNYNRDFGQADRLHLLQNARLFDRGDVGYVARIEGFVERLNLGVGNVYDFVEHKGQFFLLAEDGTDLKLYIINGDYTLNDTLTIGQDLTGFGKLTLFEDFVYIEPFNKFVYDDGGWVLNDFISTVPLMSNAVPTSSGVQATGSIDINSGYTTVTGTKASGTINVTSNLLPPDLVANITIKVEKGGTSVTTIPFTTSSVDTRREVAQKIVTAINTDLADWDAQLIDDDNFITSTVKVSSVGVGPQWNGYKISFTGDVVTERPDDGGGGDDDDNGNPRSPFPEEYPPPSSLNIESTISNTNIRIDRLFIQGGVTGGAQGTIDYPLTAIVRIYPTEFQVKTAPIVSTDSASDIAIKVRDAINTSDGYTASVTGSTVNVTSVEGGADFNGDMSIGVLRDTNNITLSVFENIVDTSVNRLTGGESAFGTLKTFTDYWYKVRFVYRDGHTTHTSYPIHVNTTNQRLVDLTIDTTGESDITSDGLNPDIEIYRKSEGEEFFLIETLTGTSGSSVSFTDDGTANIRPLDEEPIVWTDFNRTSDFIQNRYVRAGVDLFDYTLDPNNFSLSTVSSDDDNVLPKRSVVNVFAKPLYEDGTFGFHKDIGNIQIGDSNESLSVNQGTQYTEDRAIKDFGFFVESKMNQSDSTLSFNTIEIANQNIGKQETFPLTDDPPTEYPLKTRLLYAYKYLVRVAYFPNYSGGTPFIATLLYDEVFRSEADSHFQFYIVDFDYNVFGSDLTNDGKTKPNSITKQMLGMEQDYYKIASATTDFNASQETGQFNYDLVTTIYELGDAEGIKSSAFSGNMFIRPKEGFNDYTSAQIASDLEGLDIRVVGAEDMSEQGNRVSVIDSFPAIIPPKNSRIYLQLEESPLDEIDDTTVNKSKEQKIADFSFFEFTQDMYHFVPLKNNDYSLSFDLLNFESYEDASFIGNEKDVDSERTDLVWQSYEYTPTKFQLYSTEFGDLPLTYVGSKPNAVGSVDFEYSPFKVKEEDSLRFIQLKKNNIFEDKIISKDVNRAKTSYRNQILWSEPVIRESFASGTRNFIFTSFFNLPTSNGEILHIEEFNGRLIVFCEYGVAMLNVGEVVSQQQGGEMYVDTSRFITNYQWMIEKLNDMRVNTIKKYEGAMYFSDGYDVFKITQQGIENVSNGKIELSGNECSATIDPINYEYRISDCDQDVTWAYSIKSGEWFGPYTYADDAGDFINNKMLSINGGNLVQHNVGNLFDGVAYDTIIESVANDLQDPLSVKLFRKFFIDFYASSDDVEFSYSTEDTAWEVIDLSTAHLSNEYYRVGIKARNRQFIFWRIKTQEEDFTLRGVSFQLRPRRRLR